VPPPVHYLALHAHRDGLSLSFHITSRQHFLTQHHASCSHHMAYMPPCAHLHGTLFCSLTTTPLHHFMPVPCRFILHAAQNMLQPPTVGISLWTAFSVTIYLNAAYRAAMDAVKRLACRRRAVYCAITCSTFPSSPTPNPPSAPFSVGCSGGLGISRRAAWRAPGWFGRGDKRHGRVSCVTMQPTTTPPRYVPAFQHLRPTLPSATASLLPRLVPACYLLPRTLPHGKPFAAHHPCLAPQLCRASHPSAARDNTLHAQHLNQPAMRGL